MERLMKIEILSKEECIENLGGKSETELTIKILEPPRIVRGKPVCRCIIYDGCAGNSDYYDLLLSKEIYLGIMGELKVWKTKIDNDLKCLIGIIFTMTIMMIGNKKSITLRKDLGKRKR